MGYMMKTVVFSSINAVYLIVWIPVYFTDSENPVFYDSDRYETMTWFYLLLNLIYYSVWYLDKRHFEMQFNSHILGGWDKVIPPDEDKAEKEEKKD